MRLLRGAWSVLRGIKDALVLLFMLLFFAAVWAALSMQPNRAVGEGALRLNLTGVIVEQPSPADPFATVTGGPTLREFRLRDVVHTIDRARDDARVKAIVLDLDGFLGGGQVALGTVGDALERVRASGKPVFAYATAYTDDSYQLAAHASEVWLNPMGMAAIAGPGGSRPYFKGLIDRLGITTHVYRVGTFKSAVEPFIRADQSPEARQANETLYTAIWQAWLADVQAARPRAQVAAVAANPVAALPAAGQPMAAAALRTGLVDRLGERPAFDARVAEVAGAATGKSAIGYRGIRYDNFLAAHPYPTTGDAIGIATVAGTIVDGQASPGTAGGDTIARAIEDAVRERSVKAIVLRIDSPGGSALASERIRQALLQARRANIPVVASMGSVAASGGYWVSTAAQRVLAEPGTITGSIGVFGIIPTFEGALARIGITSDGVETTPLSAQPDILGGTNAAFDTLAQRSVESIYGQFLSIVSQARRIPVARVAEIAEGRVWDGGTARQLGLVDRFGGLDDAVAEAARLANMTGAPRRLYLEPDAPAFSRLLASLERENEDSGAGGDALARFAMTRQAMALSAVSEARSLLVSGGVQARCLECAAAPGIARATPGETKSLLELLVAWVRG